MTTVVLVNPSAAPGTTPNREGSGGLGVETAGSGGFVYPPQTLATVAASLCEAGYEVQALDAVAEELTIEDALVRLGQMAVFTDPLVPPIEAPAVADAETELPKLDEDLALLSSDPISPSPSAGPDVIGVVISVATLSVDLDFVNALAQVWPYTPVFVFGDAVQHVWRWVLEGSAARLAILGEATMVAPAAVQALASGEIDAVTSLDGVAYWEDGQPVHRPAPAQRGELEAIPRPAWDLLPHERYSFLTLSSSRGCDHGCAYCPYVAAQGRFRPRSPAAVALEARWLSQSFSKPRIIFRDPAFAADREHVVELCSALRRARVRTPWECESRPEHFDSDLLYRMRWAGCQTVKLGLETVDENLLAGVNRLLPGWTAARYRAHVAELVATCRRLGLNCRVFVMTGLPGETQASLEKTLAFLQAIRPPAVSVKSYQPYPGTPMGGERGTVVGYPPLTEADLTRLEMLMRATAEPLPLGRRSLLRRLWRR